MLRTQEPNAPTEVDRFASDPFAHLGREHAELSRVYRLLARVLGGADDGLGVDRGEVGTVIEHVVLLGDLRHHDKEESLLVPVLVQHGFDWFEGPVARMRRDHRQERYHFRVLEDLVEKASEWSGEDRRHLVRAGRTFLAFVTAHMEFENEQVFAPARQRLSAPTQARLLAEFERFDRAHELSKNVQSARAKIAVLIEKYVV